MSFETYTGNYIFLDTVGDVGNNFNIRSYCDDETVVYLTKPPLCKLHLTPRNQAAGVDIAWDMSNARAPTGTLDKFSIQWGGPTDIGDLFNQDWATDPKSGNVQYTINGRFTVRATVTDTLGNVSVPCKQVVTIGGAATQNLFVFIGVTTNGVWLYTGSTELMTHRSTGLTGDFLAVRGLVMHPQTVTLPLAQIALWIATLGGPAYTLNGGLTWTTIDKSGMGVPVNDAGDVPPPVLADLEIYDIMLNPLSPSEVTLFMADATERVWLYVTTDAGVSWNNVQGKR